MTIRFPGPRVWNAATWVVRGFWDDARPHLHDLPGLAEEMQFSYDTEIYTLNLADAHAERLAEMGTLVERVIADNLRTQGAGFADPSAFPGYLAKLRELEQLTVAALSTAPLSSNK